MEIPITPSFNLERRRALVTGAGRGIGLAAAAALAQAGAHVVLVARGESQIETAAATLRSSGCSVEWKSLDVCDNVAMRTMVEKMEPFNILVNNAGTNRPAPFLEVTEADYDAITEVNVRAAYFVAQAVARKMVEGKVEGSIIHMSSQMGLVGSPRRTVYCATKHAIEGMSKAMALDLAPYRIRSNTLCPTFIETPMARAFFEDPEFKRDVIKKIKLGRIGRVEDLMGAIVYLASDASALVTGSHLVVDGGWTAE